MRRKTCIIIGAGLAGLAAAHYLARRRWSVTVLEAQERFGGRVISYSFPGSKLVCELGGEWIGDNHTKIKRLCRDFKLPLIQHQYGFSFWRGGSSCPAVFRPGASPFQPSAQQAFDRFAHEWKRKKNSHAYISKLDLIDWWTHLRVNLGFTERDLLLRDLMDSTDFGETIRMVSAYVAATEYLDSNPSDEMDFKIGGGNHRLIDALVADICLHGGEVQNNAKVLEVRQSARRVTVKIEDRRETLSADRCICAIPAPCLNHIEWHPKLRPERSQAADQLEYARIVKTAVLYNRRFWHSGNSPGFSAFTSRVSDFCFDSTLLQPGEEGILCSYAVGDKADDIAAEPDQEAVMQWITSDMIEVTAPKRPYAIKPLATISQCWQRQEPLGGAYAFYRPGQWFKVRPLLAAPHHHVHFAGEHLADWQGFMEGAIDTGVSAAEAL